MKPNFEIYNPPIAAFDILKGILLYTDREKSYSCNPTKYTKFFLKMKKKFPDLFDHIDIYDDNFLPYSSEIERAYSLAMEFRILRRPNPDVYPCEISAEKERLENSIKDKFTEAQKQQLVDIAKEFENELKE